jgi:hypothetical protein
MGRRSRDRRNARQEKQNRRWEKEKPVVKATGSEKLNHFDWPQERSSRFES